MFIVMIFPIPFGFIIFLFIEIFILFFIVLFLVVIFIEIFILFVIIWFFILFQPMMCRSLNAHRRVSSIFFVFIHRRMTANEIDQALKGNHGKRSGSAKTLNGDSSYVCKMIAKSDESMPKTNGAPEKRSMKIEK